MWISLRKPLVVGFSIASAITAAAWSQALSAQTAAAPATYGDWQLDCDQASSCRLSQSILITDTQEPILVLRIYHSGGDDLAIASLPLGVFLPAGIGLMIDDQPEQRFVYETCNQSGCHVGIPLDAAMLTSLRAGQTALLRVFDGGQQPVDLPLSLQGFSQGYDALRGRAAQVMQFQRPPSADRQSDQKKGSLL